MQTVKYSYRKGDIVAFAPLIPKGLRRLYRDCKVLELYPENVPPAARIMKGDEEMIVRWDELEPLALNDQRRADERRAKVKQNCAAILEAWAAGCRTAKEIAEKLGVRACNVVSRLRQAKRYGLLKETNDIGTNQSA